jgi:SNF2 family DNA or RNA helicase
MTLISRALDVVTGHHAPPGSAPPPVPAPGAAPNGAHSGDADDLDGYRATFDDGYVQPLDPFPAYLNRPAVLEPRPYQVTGADWLYQTRRAILADDAGVGKTIQAAMAAVKPVLVVCPTYLVWQWAEFIESNFPNDTISVAAFGGRKVRHKALTGTDELWVMPDKAPADWVIVNTDMVRGYSMPKVNTIIFDEAHHFRNREAERSQLAATLAHMTDRVYELTATPIYKDVSNLFQLLHMIDPTTYKDFWPALERWAITYGDRFSMKIVRLRNSKALEKELAPYLLRRTYSDVGLFIPPLVEAHNVIEMDPRMKKIYADLRDFYRKEDGTAASSAAEVLHLLRHATVGPKIQEIPNILEDNPGPAVVFTWYRESADVCAEELTKLLRHTVVVKGDVDADQRADIAHAAIAKGGVVVATMASLGEGIDLSAAKTCIFLEEDYVPGRHYQVLHRLQRWTTDERPVVAHYLRCRGTVDTIVHHAVTTRKGDTQQILRDALE